MLPTVWIVEDEVIFREVLFDGLSMTKTLRVIAFPSCEKALEAFSDHALPPDIILLDIHLPGISGMAGIAEFRKLVPTVKIIMLTVDGNQETIVQTLKRGAFGYVLKSSGLDNVHAAISRALDNERFLDPTSLTILLSNLLGEHPHSNPYDLSDRELEVLALITAGLSREQIAERLRVTESTAIFHYRNIYRKLGERKLSAVVKKAISEGLV